MISPRLKHGTSYDGTAAGNISITSGAGTTTYAINPNAALDQVLVRTAPDGNKTFYVYGLGLLHEETGSAVHYYHHDRRGDAVALTDDNGVVTDRTSYGVYGELLSHTGTTNTPFLFNGKWGVQTDASGIYYHRARYYHPQLRRFLNQDTLLGDIDDSASLNQFAYVGNNPINFIDPLGLAYTAARPLQNSLGGVVSPFIGKGYEGKHHQIFFEDGKQPTNLGFFDDNSVRPDDAPKKLQGEYEKMNQGFYDATMRQAVENVKKTHGTQWKANDDCQDFVQRAVDEYFRLKREELMKQQKLKPAA